MSRPRSSARASSTPARGTRTPGRPGVYVATPKSDIYVALLGVALGGMILANLLLLLLMNGYGFKVTP